MSNKNWEQVGYISVDAGIVMVGDPCYSLGDSEPSMENKGLDYSQLLTMLDENNFDKNRVFSIYHGANENKPRSEGQAIVVSSGFGDGCYPVFVKRDKQGIIVSLRVDFTEDE